MTWRSLLSLLLRAAGVYLLIRIRLEITDMAEQTNAALEELQGAIAEVRGELAADDALDTDTAAKVRAAAQEIRDLRPDTPAPAEPAPVPDEPSA